MPIEGLPSSNQRAAQAASSAMISTGAERDIQKDKVKSLISIDRREAINLYGDMVSPEVIAEINLQANESPDQEQGSGGMLAVNAMRKERQRRLELFKRRVKISKYLGRPAPQGKKKFLKHWEEDNELPPPSAEYEVIVKKLKALDQDGKELLKQYVLISGKIAAGRPAEEVEAMKLLLQKIREALTKLGLDETDFAYLEKKAVLLMKEGLLFLFTKEFYSSGKSAVDFSKWVVNAKGGRVTLDIITLLEEFSVPLREKLEMLNNLEIRDVIALLDFLNIDIAAWIRSIEKSKLLIEHTELSDLYFHIAGMHSASDISYLISEYRTRKIELFLDTGTMSKMLKGLNLTMLKRRLSYLGMGNDDLDELNEQARRVAWLKAIATLKTLHINRILTTSSNEFDSVSSKISKLTSISRGVGKGISKDSIKWIEAGLEKTALAAATYKLELLRSLQKMSFDKKREFDIEHLATTISQMSKRLEKV